MKISKEDIIKAPGGHLYFDLLDSINYEFEDEEKVNIYLLDGRIIENVVITLGCLAVYNESNKVVNRHSGDFGMPELTMFERYNFKEEDIALIQINTDEKNKNQKNSVVNISTWDNLPINLSNEIYRK